MTYIISVSSGVTQNFDVYIKVGDSKVLFDCQELLIKVQSNNELSEFISVEGKLINL